jgi:hypothetical protein
MSLGELKIAGQVVKAGDPEWDQARAAWNLAVDQQPAGVAFVQGADDVASVLAFAARHQLRVTTQSTGHGAAALGPLDDTILIRTERMRAIDIDRQTRTARVEAGTLSLALGEAAQATGGCSLGGSSPDVGVAGFTLGGGLGWLGRRFGFACNHVCAIELVTAGGESKRVDADNDGDLFWALRGGGGCYAVVTALHVQLQDVSEVYAGSLLLPAEVGAEAVRGYRDWAADVSEDVTSIVRFLRLPPLPEIPEPLRGRPLLTLGAACIGSREEGQRTIAPLRALGEPIIDTFAQIPAAGLSQIHMDPEQPTPGIGHHALLSELPDEAIDAFVGVAGPEAGSPLLLAELRQLGGALARPGDRAGALSELDAAFLLSGIGVPMSPELAEAIPAGLDRLADAVAPWRSDGGYFNFAERACDVDAILPADVCERLADVKRRWDPAGTIRANHEIAVGAA